MNGKPVWYNATFKTWLPSVCICLMIWSTKLLSDPYYLFWHFLILSGQVSSDVSTLKKYSVPLCPLRSNVDLENNVHRNKHFTKLNVWYWLVKINMESFLGIFRVRVRVRVRVFVTYLTYPTIGLHHFYRSIQCLHNPVSYVYLEILDVSSHIFKISPSINPSS